jgi:hypothetical protein
MLPVLLLVTGLLHAPAAEVVRERGDGYTFERPAAWRLESFPGGYFLRTPEFGAGIIIGHVAPAPPDAEGLRKLTLTTVDGLMNVRSPVVTGQGADKVGERDGYTVRFDGNAAGGQRLKALLTAVPMPNGRVLSVFLRAIPPERLPEWELVHRRLLDSVRFDDAGALDEAAVRTAFTAYSALAASERTTTWPSLVSRRTVDYYARARELALSATEAEVRGLPLDEKLLVLTLRHRLDPDRLRAWNGRLIFDHALRQGWVDKEALVSSVLGPVEIDGDVARAVLLDGGEPLHYDVELRREDGRWKLDLVTIFRGDAVALQMRARQTKRTEDEMILYELERATSTKVSPAIWRPAR